MNHDYNYHCICGVCKRLTEHFHLKSEKEAIELGYQKTKLTDSEGEK